ncbi:F-box/kelch-repeat protein At3g23880-like [Lycium ferocissimum]|uniref:F-box/kelch-repeat protein At3g23880-like n=1 Tax=Lycium ferocissimum TaxID=112874 RepID=UPI002815DD23|nr:F-box/kelch-repeat protein At3g23880-like [Lycium ferocissimum]
MLKKMPYIPSEVIFEILLRLPLKSILKFKSVSKSWLFLLSSPQFINTHLNFSRKDFPHRLLILDRDQILSKKKCALYSPVSKKNSAVCVDLDYPVKSRGCNIPQFIGSCDGLVCLLVENSLILWNPSTRKWKEIPKEETHQMSQDYYCTYGFGYDKYNDDYKLVLLYSSKIKNTGSEVKVYSLRTNSWKKIKGFVSGYIYGNSGVLLNGIVHWDTRPHHDFNGCYNYIVSFDLETEKQGKIELPSYENEDVHWDLISSRDSLFGFCHCESQGEVDIWVMKEYGVKESWTKFASVAYYVIPGIFYLPLYVNEDGEVLLINGQSLVLFNTRNNTYKDLQIHLPDTQLRIDMATYNETLVSPVFNDEDGCKLW